MRFAVGVGLMLVAAGLACIIHGIFPSLCMKTASRTVEELKRLFVERHTLVIVLDEAYVDFANENALKLALKYPHVIVSRTFSKATRCIDTKLMPSAWEPWARISSS
jgi:hypothetical protein